MITFAKWMEDTLYGPRGYYSSGLAKTGRDGDYFTAPETGAAFGQLLARIFLQWQTRLKADPFYGIEVGAGEGRLIEIIEKECRTHPVRDRPTLVAVERSAVRREKLAARGLPIQIHADLTSVSHNSIHGIIFSNELIDAFPVHRVRMNQGTLEELYVEPPRWSVPSTPALAAYLARLNIHLPDGYETEINLAMADWLQQASTVLKGGFIVLIDYGRPAWDYYAEERAGGTLRCFKDHRVFNIDAWEPGSDITADVDFTSLALDAKAAGLEPLAFMEMGTFLRTEGVKGGGGEGGSGGWGEMASSTLQLLLHPDGLGAQFHVLILGKNIDPQEWTFEHNRLRRLGLPA